MGWWLGGGGGLSDTAGKDGRSKKWGWWGSEVVWQMREIWKTCTGCNSQTNLPAHEVGNRQCRAKRSVAIRRAMAHPDFYTNQCPSQLCQKGSKTMRKVVASPPQLKFEQILSTTHLSHWDEYIIYLTCIFTELFLVPVPLSPSRKYYVMHDLYSVPINVSSFWYTLTYPIWVAGNPPQKVTYPSI